MRPTHQFLQAVEARLRCPVDRRPAVIEELRGHLEDRVESLVQGGLGETDAERQAVREMRPTWLLALRLSAANGWNVTAHVLRELWAAGVALLMVLPTPVFLYWVSDHVASGLSVGAAERVLVGLVWTVSMAGLVALGFALGRTVRGWGWAAALLAAQVAFLRSNSSVFVRHPAGATLWVAAGLAVLLSGLVGQRREWPKIQWLGWAGAGLIGAPIPLALISFQVGAGASLAQACAWLVQLISSSARALLGVVIAAAVPWLFWMGAWVIERTDRAAGPDLASSS